MKQTDFPKEIKEAISEANLRGLEHATRNFSLMLLICEMDYKKIELFLDYLKDFFKGNSYFQWDDNREPLFCNHFVLDHPKG